MGLREELAEKESQGQDFVVFRCDDMIDMLDQMERLKSQVRYWSYCTWEGMRKWCPEKREELQQFLGDELGISPYDYKPSSDWPRP